jgi:hypothetical protein
LYASELRGVEELRRTLEDADSGSKVVDPPGSLESSDDDRGRGNEIVSESVVEIAL